MKDIHLSSEIAIAASHYHKEREYWLEQLSGQRARSRFPYDRDPQNNAAESRQFSFDTTHLQFQDHISAQLLKLSNGANANLYMILAAAMVVVLNKYSGNSDIILGTPVLKQDDDAEFINRILALRTEVAGSMTFKELLFQTRKTIIAANENQNYPMTVLLDQLNIPYNPHREFPLFDAALLLENIHDPSYLRTINLNMIFSFSRVEDRVIASLTYNALGYLRSTAERIVRHVENLMQIALFNIDIPVAQIGILSPREREQLLAAFNDNASGCPAERTVHQLFAEQADRTPGHVALVFRNNSVTYRQLDEQTNQLANYFYHEKKLQPDHRVGVLMDRSLELIVALLGVMKAGGAYVPLDPSLPEERLRLMLVDAGAALLLSQKKYIRTLNRLQWSCQGLDTFLCLDSSDIPREGLAGSGEVADLKKLWNYVAKTATDDITGGGWGSSYTGQPFSCAEMDEYAENIFQKLNPLLDGRTKVLEIGCASGISMYRLAPKAGLYYGTDLSEVIIEKNRSRVQQEGLKNITLQCLPAHEIDSIDSQDFDLIIMNSVIQAFHDHNYLRDVIAKAIHLLGPKGHIFVGDIMDQDLKSHLIHDLLEFKKKNRNKTYITKTDFASELFVCRGFFEDLRYELPAIAAVKFSRKIHTLETECTKFRYDALMVIDKHRRNQPPAGQKQKHQDDLTVLKQYPGEKSVPTVTPGNYAYVMYTSGSSGTPKGVVVEHRTIVNTLHWRKHYYRFTPDDVSVQIPSYYFDSSVTDIFTPLISGTRVVLIEEQERFNLPRLAEIVVSNRTTHIIVVPGFYNIILDEIPGSLVNLKEITVAGDDFSEELVVKHVERLPGVRVHNEYGPTENSVNTTAYLFKPGTTRVLIGKPIDNVAIYILNKNRQLNPVGVQGEMYLAGASLTRGYLNNPELTAEYFVENPFCPGQRMYRTGDMAKWLPDGNIEFLGRVDSQVKIRGFRIELGEIENQLMKREDVEKVIVLARENTGYGENDRDTGTDTREKYICAYLVPGTPDKNRITAASTDPDAGDTVSEYKSRLREYLTEKLPEYMIPAYFIFLDTVPLTPNGKIDRKALPDPVVAKKQHTPPRGEVEIKLARIWAEILSIEPGDIGRDTNFFEVGGHSLRAIVMISKIHKELNIKLPLTAIFQSQTIRDLAGYINGSSGDRVTFTTLQAVEEKEFYPLSSGQERLYILYRLDETSTAYNQPVILGLEGHLDTEKLVRGFRQMVRRHSSLRTSFQEVQDAPVQQVHPPHQVTIDLEYHHLDEGEGADGEQEKKIVKQFVRPFDLSRAPLLRASVIRRNAADWVFMLDLHHIISDGASQSLLVNQLIGIYAEKKLPGLNLRYHDYSQWQHSPQARKTREQQEAFWLDEFSGEVQLLDLPLDYERPSIQRFDGDSVPWLVAARETRLLKEIALKEDATIYMVILAVINILFSKICDRRDICIGAGTAGRLNEELQHIIGMFVNTLVLRNYPAAEKTFSEFLRDLKERTLKAFENQDYPFEELVNRLVPHRESNRNPLFDVALAFNNFEIQDIYFPGTAAGGLTLSAYPHPNKTAQFDINFIGQETGDELTFTVAYQTALFKKETIARFIGYLNEIIADVTTNQHIRLAEISISHDLLKAESTRSEKDIEGFNF